VVGLAVGAAVGFLGTVTIIAPRICACPAVLVLEIGFESTGAIHGSSYSTYSFTVTNVSNGAPTYRDLSFYFFNRSGERPQWGWEASWSWQLVGGGSNLTTHVNSSNGNWVGFGSLPILVGQMWSIDVPGPSLDGGAVTAYGEGSYTGWVSVGIQ
jgi:hypothetical protein